MIGWADLTREGRRERAAWDGGGWLCAASDAAVSVAAVDSGGWMTWPSSGSTIPLADGPETGEDGRNKALDALEAAGIEWALTEAPALRGTGPWEEREPGRKWARNDLGSGAWALVDMGPGTPAYRWSASLNGENGSGWHHTPEAARDAADAWLASRGVVLDTQPDALPPEPVVLDHKATLHARPPERGEFDALAERVAALEARTQPAPTTPGGERVPPVYADPARVLAWLTDEEARPWPNHGVSARDAQAYYTHTGFGDRIAAEVDRLTALLAAQPAPTPGTGDAPTARDPRQDPRAGDVLWVRGCAVQVEGAYGGCVFAPLRWTLDEWRERTAGAEVLRVTP